MNLKTVVPLVLTLSIAQHAPAAPLTLSTSTGKLFGTLELPKSPSPCPVALILAGSGPTDRDGNSPLLTGKNDSLKMLADGLAKHGIASLRIDKRGIAASTAAGAKEADLRFETYIDDAVLWGKRLQKDRRFTGVTIIGHSEGSLIGMVAARKLPATGFISIAGPGRPLGDIILEQLRPQLPAAMMKQTEAIIRDLNNGKTVANTPAALASLFRPSVQPYLISCFRYLPTSEIKKLKSPVLLVQGTTDVQVKTTDAQLLAKANPGAKLLIISGMNHIFKDVPADRTKQIESYSDPTLPIDAKLVTATAGFINQIKPIPALAMDHR